MRTSRCAEWRATLCATLAAAAAVGGLRALVVSDPSAPGTEFLPDMVRSPAWLSQFDGAPTADGLAERPRVEGVVVRGALPIRFGGTPDEALRAGRELVNPFARDDGAAAARGADVYARFCAPCHAADGGGEGPVVVHGMLRPPSLLAERAVGMRDGEMFHVLTKGQGNMASYAVQVDPEDRWRIVLHVRMLQEARPR